MRLLLLALLLTASAASAQSGGRFRTVVYAGPLLGANAIGGRVGYELRRAHRGPWSLPISFELTVADVNDPDNEYDGLFVGYSGGASLAHRLGPSTTHLQAGVQVSLGTEKVEDDRDLLLGTRLRLGVIHYPTDTGFTVGAGVYGMRIFGSEFYPEDVGVIVTVGRQL